MVPSSPSPVRIGSRVTGLSSIVRSQTPGEREVEEGKGGFGVGQWYIRC